MKKTLALTAASFLLVSTTALGQKDWVYYGQDQGATRYSTLTQITTANVAKLKRAWTFHTGDKSGFFESTPIVVDSVMFFAAGNGFYALDAVTGTQIWKVEATRTTRRGVSYWPGDAKSAPRIIASAGTELMALDAKTGKPIADFGDDGVVELEDSMNSPAAIYKDLAIVQGNKPWIRAWNIRSGKLEWTFNLIPQPGEKGHETWDGESWKSAGGTNVWGLLSIDAPRGLVFLPVSMPGNNDYYGGDHHGDNLFGTSVVAVEAATGKLRWYRQLVHHDIWDYDLGAAPTLVDVVKNGKSIPAIAEVTKMGLLFVLDRTTGEPGWGIDAQGRTREDYARARGVLRGPLGQIQTRRRGAVSALERQAGHHRVPRRGRRWKLERRHRQSSARLDDHERDERGAVGTSRARVRRARASWGRT
jgi:quinoprotein glucose dehydrogenase